MQFHPDKSLLGENESHEIFAKVNDAYKKVKNGHYIGDIRQREKQFREKEGAWGSVLDMLLRKFSGGSNIKFYLCKILVYMFLLFIATIVILGFVRGYEDNKGYFRLTMHPKFNMRVSTPCNGYAVFLERDFYTKYDILTQKRIFNDAETLKLKFYREKCQDRDRRISILKGKMEIAGHEQRLIINDEIRSLSNDKICLEYDIGFSRLRNCSSNN